MKRAILVILATLMITGCRSYESRQSGSPASAGMQSGWDRSGTGVSGDVGVSESGVPTSTAAPEIINRANTSAEKRQE